MSTKQINQLPSLNDKIPVVIFTSTEMNRTKPTWSQFQHELFKQTLNGKLVVVDSSHYVMKDRPIIICRALKSMVNRLSDTKR